MADEEVVGLFNANEGIKGRDGGPYLDQVQDTLAEIARAAIEDRDPVSPPPASVGTPLVTETQLIANFVRTNIDHRNSGADTTVTVDPVAEVPVSVIEADEYEPPEEEDPVEGQGFAGPEIGLD